jgi:cellulose synthase/poly-beta-1,6-N-acetylglucosamine synthase-like glycosyltransferase
MKELLYYIVNIYDYFFVYYLLSLNFIYFLLLFFATLKLLKQKQLNLFSNKLNILLSEYVIPISILVPCYNEDISICETIYALSSLEYKEFEIIVINDGSTDNSLQHLIDEFQLVEVTPIYDPQIETQEVRKIYLSASLKNLIVIDKANGGKSDALNAGINMSSHPLVVSIDADTIIDNSSLTTITKPFVENYAETACVGGTILIVNGCTVNKGSIQDISLPKNMLAKFQIIEYFSAFICGRLGFSFIDSLLIISGAFGIFKKDLVLAVNGYSTDTIGEDMDLIIKIHKHLRQKKSKQKITFLPEPVCWTMCPEDFKSFYNQRRRWHWGLLDNLITHRDLFFNVKYGKLSLIGYNYFLFFEGLEPIISFLGFISFIVTFAMQSPNFTIILYLFLTSVLLGVFITIYSVIITEATFERYSKISDYIRLIFYSILQNIGYRQMGSIIRFLAILKYKYKSNVWGKQQRITLKG